MFWLSTIRLFFFSLMFRPLPESTLFPYTTLFRSPAEVILDHELLARGHVDARPLDLHPHAQALERRQDRGDERPRSEEHTSEVQSRERLVCRHLLEKKKRKTFKVQNHQINRTVSS